jgi:hypothetical protein
MYILETSCQIQIAAQAGGRELILLDEEITHINRKSVAEVTAGQGGQIAWAAMIDKVERHDPSFRN